MSTGEDNRGVTLSVPFPVFSLPPRPCGAAAGLTEEEIRELKELVRKIVASGVTVLLVEHRMSFVMDICGRITVLDHGRVIAEGAPEEVAYDPQVIEAYLGAPMEAKGEESAAG